MSLFGLTGVLADSQDVGGTVPGHIDFSLTTLSLDYGSVIPGGTSAVKTTTLSVAADNNVDFNMDITLATNPNGLFQNIYLESTTVPDTYTDQLSSTLVRIITDSSAGIAFDTTIKSVLKVPLAATPVVATGTVTYTISASQPPA